MEISVLSKKENPLLQRNEVRFKIVHSKEKSPDRDTVRDKLAAILNEKKDTVIVDSMRALFGKAETFGYAKVYKTKEQALKVERGRTLVRNKLREKKVKVKADAKPKEGAGGRAGDKK